MLSRLLARTTNLRLITTLILSNNSPQSSLLLAPCLSTTHLRANRNFIFPTSRLFSSNRNSNGDDSTKDPSISGSWKLTPDNDEESNSIFGDDGDGDFAGFADEDGKFDDKLVKPSIGKSNVNVEAWGTISPTSSDVFADVDKGLESMKGGGDDEWKTAEGYKTWSFDEEEKSEVFDIGEGVEGLPGMIDENVITQRGTSEADQQLESERQELMAQLKGPNRAFGDLIAASGITDVMLDSLIALKDLDAVEGLPPLHVIEDLRLAKNEKTNTRAEMERQKQEEIAKSRVRRVDDKGRAYGTGRRKCSVARVFIQPGDGKFLVNDKQFDVYFPILDNRADLLRPFSETKTLGLWDVTCTVKGGGVSGQVGAIRLGISRALQNWEPGLRQNLRAVGFLTRDPRMVERKKPGKAKARKSYQWVKR